MSHVPLILKASVMPKSYDDPCLVFTFQLAQAFVPFMMNDIDVSEFYELPYPDGCVYEPEVPDPSCL